MFYTNVFFKCIPSQRIATAALCHNNQVNDSLIRHTDYVEACRWLMQMQCNSPHVEWHMTVS